MADSTSAIEFLNQKKTPEVPAVCVLFGDEPLLKREALERIRSAVLTGDDSELSLTTFDGEQVELRQVLDELATVSMFGSGRRMVVVDEADKFVKEHREQLEDYSQKPRPASVLMLLVDSWPSNTRLFKKLAESGLQVNCNLPRNRFGEADEDAVLKWIAARAEANYGAKLNTEAGQQLLEIVGPQLGRLDQELAKLALLAASASGQGSVVRDQNQQLVVSGQGSGGKDQTAPSPQPSPTRGEGRKRHPHPGPLPKGEGVSITRELVEQAVGGWRAKTAWSMIEAALEGRAAVAIVELDRLLLAGEEPIPLLAMMSGSLRRMAAATRIIEDAESNRRRISLADALREAGVTPKKFVLDKTERQLRQIGRGRARYIYDWLLQADLALKGVSSSGERARLVLEELIVRLSTHAAASLGSRAMPAGNR